MIALFRRVDDLTWSYLPLPFKSVLDRSSWWKLLLVYSTLVVLLVYRFFFARGPILVHAPPSTRLGDNHSNVQTKELIIHLMFFFVPMFIAYFTRPRQNIPHSYQ